MKPPLTCAVGADEAPLTCAVGADEAPLTCAVGADEALALHAAVGGEGHVHLITRGDHWVRRLRPAETAKQSDGLGKEQTVRPTNTHTKRVLQP